MLIAALTRLVVVGQAVFVFRLVVVEGDGSVVALFLPEQLLKKVKFIPVNVRGTVPLAQLLTKGQPL